MKTNIHFFIIPRLFFLECKMFQTNVLEKSKHTFYVLKLFSEYSAVYEITWKKTPLVFGSSTNTEA